MKANPNYRAIDELGLSLDSLTHTLRRYHREVHNIEILLGLGPEASQAMNELIRSCLEAKWEKDIANGARQDRDVPKRKPRSRKTSNIKKSELPEFLDYCSLEKKV